MLRVIRAGGRTEVQEVTGRLRHVYQDQDTDGPVHDTSGRTADRCQDEGGVRVSVQLSRQGPG